MGPERNQQLFTAVAADIMPLVDEEFVRRNLVVPALAELAEQFARKDNSPRPVTEPTLFARLYALSMVQRSRMGISGFDPLSTFDNGGKVEAKAAPYHDEFTAKNKGTYRTRIIQFVLPGQDVNNNINIFGVNFYEPNPEEDEAVIEASTFATQSGIVIVDKRGSVTNINKDPISGETVLFAVHNKVTNDAKIYQVTLESAAVATSKVDLGMNQIEFENEASASVRLPDARIVLIKQLNGELQQQAVSELEKALSTLKGIKSPDGVLSTEEKYAAIYTARTVSG